MIPAAIAFGVGEFCFSCCSIHADIFDPRCPVNDETIEHTVCDKGDKIEQQDKKGSPSRESEEWQHKYSCLIC